MRVKAFGLNRADTSQRQGNYPPLPGITDILGLEISGVIEEVGAEVGKGDGTQAWKKGDEVFALLYGGGYAEYVVVHQRMLVEKPKDWSWEYAAGLSEVRIVFVGRFVETLLTYFHRYGSRRFKLFILLADLILHVCGRSCGTQGRRLFLLLVYNSQRTPTVTTIILPQPQIYQQNLKYSLRLAQIPNASSVLAGYIALAQ